MKAFSILLLLAIEQEILTASVSKSDNHEPEFFQIIEKKCPSFAANKQFADQKIFQNCKNWKEINETTHLRENNTNNVLCLLYYDTFVPFCTSIEKAKSRIHNVTLNLTEDLKNYTPSTICKNLALFPANKTFEHNITEIFKTESICFKLCTNFDDTPVDYCSMAYYFANYNVSSLDQTSKTPETETDQKPLVSTTVVTKHAGNDSVANNSITPNLVPATNHTVNSVNSTLLGKQSVDPSLNLPDAENNDHNEKEASHQKTQDEVNINNVNIEGNKPISEYNSEPEKQLDNRQQISVSTEKKHSSDTAEKKADKPMEVLSVGNEKEDNEKEDNENKAAAAVETEKPVQNHTAEKQAPLIEKKKDDEDEEAEKKHIAEEDVEENPNLDGEQGSDFDEDEGEHGEVPDAQSEIVQEPILQNSGPEEKNEKPINTVAETPVNFNTIEEIDGESNFFNYFMVICLLFVLGYVGYHNRQKVLALVLEGKRGKRQYRGRRPNSANYHKLDSNLEEAISSSCSKNSSNIIY